MSSSLTYTLTKLRSLPPASNRCFRRSGNCAVNLSSASSTLAASIVTDALPPAYWRRAVGIEIEGMMLSPPKMDLNVPRLRCPGNRRDEKQRNLPGCATFAADFHGLRASQRDMKAPLKTHVVSNKLVTTWCNVQ